MTTSDQGLFIVIDGIHGCGKTTIVEHLTRHLKATGHPVVATREIGGTPLGNKIRHLVDTLDEAQDPETALLLILAARAKHVKDLIRPGLAQNRIVITDRFTPSTYVYQYYCIEKLSGQIEYLELIRHLNDFVTDGLTPDLTIILDVPVDVALRRQEQSQRSRKRTPAPLRDQEKAREGYVHFADSEGWIILNADRSSQAVLETVEELLAPLLMRLTTPASQKIQEPGP